MYNLQGQLAHISNPEGATHYINLGKQLIAKLSPNAEYKEKSGYTGHLEDKDIGLTYMQQRYYDPVVGRFYSNDPVGFTASNPMMFNRYAYANNNPYKYVDPDGQLGQIAVGGIIGAVVGAGVETYKQVESGKGLSFGAIAAEGFKGGVVGAAAATGGVFMGALGKAAEASAGGLVAGTAVGNGTGAIIGSAVTQVGEATYNAVQGEGFQVSNVAESNAELVGNAVGASLGQPAGALVKALTGSSAISAVTRESVSTGATEMVKQEIKEK